MKKIILIASLLMAGGLWAYNETDLLKLEAINQCPGCDLSGADLSWEIWPQNPILEGANLEGANLSKADLTNVDSIGRRSLAANLRGVNLSGANLTDTDLATKGPSLINVKLDGVIYCRTKMPWGELNDGCE